jgi:hypothetical protein
MDQSRENILEMNFWWRFLADSRIHTITMGLAETRGWHVNLKKIILWEWR